MVSGRPARMATRAAVVMGATAWAATLLRRMRREFDSTGTMSAPTVTAMYGTYAAHAAVTALAARRQVGRLPLPASTSVTVGGVVALGGAGLCVAGMTRFAGAGQISGTEVGELASGGVYRYTRNPQYLGYVLFLTGLGLARRSTGVLGLAAAVALAFRWWVPVEERHLDRDVGPAYRRYRGQTARWLGRPR